MSAKKGAPKGKGKRGGSGKKKAEDEIDPVITTLVRQNEELKAQNAQLQESETYYRDKLHAVVQHVLDVNVDNFKPEKGVLLVDIPESEVKTLITNLTITPMGSLHAYEMRLEELETRITQVTNELAKLLKLKLKVENGLQDMERMYSVEDLRVQAKRLWYDCCSTHIFVAPQQLSECPGKSKTVASEIRSRPSSVLSEMTNNHNSIREPEIPPIYLQVLNPKARSIDLTPTLDDSSKQELPEKKYPGETHIFEMNSSIRSDVIRYLSRRKASRDWRVFALRVGIPGALVDEWLKMRAPYAMALVLKVWGDSQGATVRMLHRHLASPQMQCVVLAKKISDFYDVD